MLDQAIIDLHLNSSSPSILLTLQRQPYPPYETDYFVTTLYKFLAPAVFVPYIFIVIMVTQELILERQTHMKVF